MYNDNIGIGYLLIFIGFGITFLAQILLKSNYNKYKNIVSSSKICGKDVARKILDSNGLKNVKINEISGELTDHYDPRSKTVNLSSAIYGDNSIASVAVAAHECVVPIVNLSTKIGYIVIVISLAASLFNLAMVGFIMIMASLVFQLITLPVEFNASSRAKKQINKLDLVSKKDQSGVSKMLFAAALTYVAAVLSTIMQLLRLLLMILGGGNRRRN